MGIQRNIAAHPKFMYVRSVSITSIKVMQPTSFLYSRCSNTPVTFSEESNLIQYRAFFHPYRLERCAHKLLIQIRGNSKNNRDRFNV